VSLFYVQMLAFLTIRGIAYLFGRHVWFSQNSTKKIPSECSGILTRADGSIVYMKEVSPGEEVLTIKQCLRGRVREDLADVSRLRRLRNRSELAEAIFGLAFHSRWFSARGDG
jgi:hypothetical protein